MSGIWSAFACCFPRKRTRKDDGTASETGSLLAHSVHEDVPAPTANKPQSIVSYEQPQAGTGGSTVGYGAVGQGHAVLGEEGRLRVQSIASAVENRMISINHPTQSNLGPYHYSQSRRVTPSKQDAQNARSTTSSPASMAEEPAEAPPLISLPPAETSAGAQNQEQDSATRPDLARSRSSTSSSFSQTQNAQIEGVRRVNLNLGGMWERERERERGRGGKKGSVGSNSAAIGGTVRSNASVKSGRSTGKKEKEEREEQVAVPLPAVPASATAGSSTAAPAQETKSKTEDKPMQVEVEAEAEPVPMPATEPVAESTVMDVPAPPQEEPAQPAKDEPSVPAAVKADENDEEAPGTTTPGSGGNGNGGGGKGGRGKKKKNRGRGRGRGGKGGR